MKEREDHSALKPSEDLLERAAPFRDIQEKLLNYDWPGNVRELANVIERAVVLGQEPIITLQDLPPRIAVVQRRAMSKPPSYRAALEASRRELILKALNQHRGNRAAAATALGIHRAHLQRLMKALGIE